MLGKPTASKSTHALPALTTQLYPPPTPPALSPHNIHCCNTPPVNILDVLPVDQTPIRHDTMGYPYPQDAIYTNPSWTPPFPSANRTGNKYQAKRSNISGQQNNYSNVIQIHALQDQQCLISARLDNKPIMILIDKGCPMSLLD